MKPVLITPVTLEPVGHVSGDVLDNSGVSLYDPALGVLTLDAELHRAGVTATVFDLNGLVCDLYVRNQIAGPRDLGQIFAPKLAALDADMFGFGTICSSYPLTVRIAQEVKK